MQGCCCLVTKVCPALCDPMDYVLHQTSLSMGFPRQEYWSGDTGDLLLLQKIFPTQGLNSSLLHWQTDSLMLNHQGTPKMLEVIYV